MEEIVLHHSGPLWWLPFGATEDRNTTWSVTRVTRWPVAVALWAAQGAQLPEQVVDSGDCQRDCPLFGVTENRNANGMVSAVEKCHGAMALGGG
ncbi:hypothetical protein ACFXDF_18960 [Streptomyces sp. NPDC059426]|uniref:hypothetical protein n=1 Tax=Streptomyces sp. NPDC059426 TaxID=3346827 RepID=UPI0036B95FFD